MYILFLNSESTEFQEGTILHWSSLVYLIDPTIKVHENV